VFRGMWCGYVEWDYGHAMAITPPSSPRSHPTLLKVSLPHQCHPRPPKQRMRHPCVRRPGQVQPREGGDLGVPRCEVARTVALRGGDVEGLILCCVGGVGRRGSVWCHHMCRVLDETPALCASASAGETPGAHPRSTRSGSGRTTQRAPCKALAPAG